MSDTVVSTSNGKVKGQVVNLQQKDAKLVYQYRNIPFAKPPIGKLRFMPPQPADSWDGVKDGTVFGNKPMYDALWEAGMMKYFPQSEGEITHDEDCLHLSIYTPSIEKGKKLPVMVWFYGGAFYMGSEREYDGTVLAGMNDVVVVIPNYRVGIFGLFSLGPSSICPGNQGLMDQQLALKWVQSNISAFGGDRGNVTIFGQSAGASSVNIHVLSPLSRGLFHKAISQSGTATTPGAFLDEKTNAKNVKRFLEHIKVEEEDEFKILGKLQKMTADELLKASTSPELMMEKVTFQPVFGEKLFPQPPEEILNSKNFAKVPYIIGCNSTEGQGMMTASAGPDFEKGITEEVVKQSVFFPLTDQGFEKCKNFYLKPEDQDETRYSKMLGKILGDAVFVAPSMQVANACSDAGSNIYVYQGNFKLKMSHDKEYMGELQKKVDWCICDHGDDIHMTFGIPFFKAALQSKAKYTEDETKLSKAFMTYLTNFARTGDPNKGREVEVTWPKYQPKDKAHLVLENPISTGKNLAEEEADFWQNEMAKHTKRDA